MKITDKDSYNAGMMKLAEIHRQGDLIWAETKDLADLLINSAEAKELNIQLNRYEEENNISVF